MKIFVAVPAYDCKVHIGTALSLAHEMTLATAASVEFRIAFQPGMALVHSARNLLCQRFLESDATHLVFIDADCGWNAGALVRLCMKQSADVVAGVCRRRKEPESYALNWLEDRTPREDGLITVEAVGMAFACIPRKTLEVFKAATPERSYQSDGETLHAFFDSPVRDGCLWGEDFAFCNKLRELGGAVWIDPDITLRHLDGVHTFEGTLARFMERKPEGIA